MRIRNLKQEDKVRFKSDISFVKIALSEELEALKEDLLHRPLDQVENLRGQAVMLAAILKLL